MLGNDQRNEMRGRGAGRDTLPHRSLLRLPCASLEAGHPALHALPKAGSLRELQCR